MGYISKFKCVIALIAVLALSASAYAAPITGSISFSGAWAPVGGLNTIGTATGVDILGDAAFVSCSLSASCTGTYLAVNIPTIAMYNDFSFAPLGGSINPLWSFSHMGKTYSFELESVAIVQQLPNFLTLTGTGKLSATGFDDTQGAWSFSGDTSGGTIAFSATNSVPRQQVPEPANMVMFGIGLIGVGAYINRHRHQLLH